MEIFDRSEIEALFEDINNRIGAIEEAISAFPEIQEMSPKRLGMAYAQLAIAKAYRDLLEENLRAFDEE